jgi:hypothetical protein
METDSRDDLVVAFSFFRGWVFVDVEEAMPGVFTVSRRFAFELAAF